MALDVVTNDCSALTDSDLDEMASMGGAFDIGLLSKAKEDWVLSTTARDNGKLHGYTFSTLERLGGADAMESFVKLTSIIPRNGHKAVGEERAWGRRLAKKFGVESNYDQDSFVVKTNGQSGFLDFETLKPEKIKPEVASQFTGVNASKGGALIVHGWTMAESLIKLGRPS